MIKKNKFLVFSMFFIFVFSLFSVFALEGGYCCEKTKSGAICQSGAQSECDTSGGLSALPTACSQTSYCRLGTCVDSDEGRCLSNTPQKECEEIGGTWSEKSAAELTQCSFGCCLFADQSAFTTQARCGILGSIYGLDTTYRPDITNEIQCLASAGESEEGACIIEADGVRDCKRLTKSECLGLEATNKGKKIEFHEGYLCTANFLDSRCKPRGGTTLVAGESGVYFKDTCGNVANIYDSSKLNDNDYWQVIIPREESCGYDAANGNKLSTTCGNCEYLLGTIGKKYDRNDDRTVKPAYGEYVCADLSCKYEGKTYQHGDRWCATNNVPTLSTLDIFTKEKSNTQQNILELTLPGTEQYVLKCYNGEVLTESCTTGDWRNKICVQEEVNGRFNAKCMTNQVDCLTALTEEDCASGDFGECKWVEGFTINALRDEKGKPLTKDANGKAVEATCVSKYPLANDFWNGEGDVANTCNLASSITVVKYKVPLYVNIGNFDGNNDKDRKERMEYCDENCQALNTNRNYDNWLEPRLEICASMGDCAATVNYIGEYGTHSKDDLVLYKFVKKAKNLEGELEETQEELYDN